MITRASIGLAFVATLACAPQQAPVVVGNAGGPAGPESYGRTVRDAYRKVRAATALFHDVTAAGAAGYPVEVAQCLANGTDGAMGFHHVNRAYLSNTLQVERPQILLYERDAKGAYALTGVEYIVPYRLWSRDSTPPVIMGRNLARSDQLSLWYLHVWVWKPNPAGLFADWNPDVRCPPAPSAKTPSP